jgi:DNA-binding NarL/FixJ family response regulator
VIRVAVADDHPVFRSGLRTLVQEADGLTFAGEAASGTAIVELCLAERPDVVLMDIRMPGVSGIDATRQILAAEPETGILMLTMLEDDTSVFAALRAGARGYVLKGAGPDEIMRAITAVAAGEIIVGAAMLAAGASNAVIAERLALSEKTIRNNVSAILTKLQVTDRPAAIVRARDAGLGQRSAYR